MRTTRKYARSVARSTSRKKTTTGLAEPILVNTQVKCGGAAERLQRRLRVVRLASTSARRMTRMMLENRRTKRIRASNSEM